MPESSPPPASAAPLRPSTLGRGGAAALAFGVVLAGVIGWPGGPVFTTAWTTAVFGLLALGAALLSAAAGQVSAAAGRDAAEASVASALTARRAYGQQLYELARATHADFTTGEVAAARERLGRLVRARRTFDESAVPETRTVERARREAYEDAVAGDGMEQLHRDWLALLWCLQRIHATLSLLGEAPAEARVGTRSPREFLVALIQSQIRTLNDDATDMRAALEEYDRAPVDDEGASNAFMSLVHDLLQGVIPAAPWSRRLTTEDGETIYHVVLPDPGLPLHDFTDDQLQSLHEATSLVPDRLPDRELLAGRFRIQAGRAQGEIETRLVGWAETFTVAGPATPGESTGSGVPNP